MLNRAYTPSASAVVRVLVVAQDAAASAPLCLELMRRGASVSALSEIAAAGESVRREAFDVVLIGARADANATALLLRMLKAEALGAPRILLLVDPQEAATHGHAIFAADETLASTLAPETIADATGIGVDPAPPKAQILPTAFEAPKMRILALPAGISRDLLPRGVIEAERGEIPDAVILTEPDADAAISAWMSAATAAVMPVIDASGRRRQGADATVGILSGVGLAEALDAVKPLTTRMRELPDSYHRTRDPKRMLLARLAVRDRAMTARCDFALKQIVAHADEAAVGGAAHQAEALVRLGLLERRFFDKLQCCPSCRSSRLLVREECAKCRSADIAEEPIIHHLRCGCQGPERDFRQGRELICPKCRQHCEHFSVDYDKPGSLVLCNGCGHATGDAEVGFRCLDCDTCFAADHAETRVFYEYLLTDAGRRQAFDPPVCGYGDAGEDDQPLSVRDRLRRFVRANAEAGKPCAALMVKIDPDGETLAAIGHKRFHQALALYASILREVVEQEVETIESATTFLVMIDDERATNVETSLPEIRRELEQNIAVDLRARYHVFGPDELDTLL